MRPATIRETRHFFEQLCHREDWQQLKKIATTFFPAATRVVVSQRVDQSGLRVVGLTFCRHQHPLHFLDLTEQERLARIKASRLLAANYDPDFETLNYLQHSFDNTIEALLSLESTMYDDCLEFDLENEPTARWQLYVDEQ